MAFHCLFDIKIKGLESTAQAFLFAKEGNANNQ